MTVEASNAALEGKRILITGGAGFIGSRLTRALAGRGAQVTVFDSLLEQVHGPSPTIELPATVLVGDIRDPSAVERAVAHSNPEIVVHLAAETGTGQSADQPARYSQVNVVGTAQLIEILRDQPTPPERFVLAATRAVYGEGAYRNAEERIVAPPPRANPDMERGCFEVIDASGRALEPVPTGVDLPPSPGSVYGSTKLMQEYLLTQIPSPWGHVMLRLQNVYGPGQSLRNPYTGVLSIFCNQAMRGEPINVYEDGKIYRDFVFIDDVVDAFVAGCHEQSMLDETFNIGTGHPVSILDAARSIMRQLGRRDEDVTINGMYRPGDVRYAVADISRTLATGAWQPKIDLEEGISRLVAWVREEAEVARLKN